MHAPPDAWGKRESLVDAEVFFIAPDGKSDLRAELIATLRAFHAPATGQPDEHAQCRFPARLLFAVEKLGLQTESLPSVACPKFEDYMRRTESSAVSVIFSSYYLNNPASAFGHVFLRIEKARKSENERADLLDYGVDFGAGVDTDNALVYAIKGITGAYPGTFRMMPYFYKVREYNDYESRDLWEYVLDLTPLERVRLTAHLWELGPTYFDYYYLSENCAYHIIAAVEAALPDRALVEHLSWPVLPGGAIKTLRENEGLIREIRFRPSLRAVFASRLSAVDESDLDMVGQLAEDPETPIPDDWSLQRRVVVLDAASDLVEVRHTKVLLIGDRTEAPHRLKQRLLERRASLLAPSAPLVTKPGTAPPDETHDSGRFGFGLGLDENRESYRSLTFRLALHDLADPVSGFPELLSLEFLPTRLRWQPDRGSLRLEESWLVRIFSLTPLSRFARHMSWHVRLGAHTPRDAPESGLTAAGIVGGGVTLGTADGAVTWYVLGLSSLEVPTGDLSRFPLRLGAGPHTGLRIRLSPNVIALSQAEWFWFPFQESDDAWGVTSQLRWGFDACCAANLAVRNETVVSSADLSLLFYF
jgi:hypothetical protein